MNNQSYLSALKKVLEELQRDFNEAKINPEFYYNRLTGIYREIAEIEGKIAGGDVKPDLEGTVTITTGDIIGSSVKIAGREISITREDKKELESVKDEVSNILKNLPRLALHNQTPPEPNFVGCVETLNTITSWYKSKDVHIGALIGWGGVGKSALVRRWYDSLKENKISPDGIFWWGFYRNAYFDRFIDAFLRYVSQGSIEPEEIKGSWQKIEKIKEFILKNEYLIILDGLEEMQKVEVKGGEFGAIDNPDFTELLKFLADSEFKGLCLITTRYPLTDLRNYKGKTYHYQEIERLSPDDAFQLLQKLGVKGTKDKKENLIKEYDGHALSLTLLAGYLVEDFHDDIKKAKEIPPFHSDKEAGGKAHRILLWYDKALTDDQKAFMKIFSLFRGGVREDSFKGVFQAKMETHINQPLIKINEFTFRHLIKNLTDRRLIQKGQDNTYTTHPLIKNYFEYVFEEKDKKLCHKYLYQYFGENAPKEPKTLEEMQALFEQIYHGCKAGMYEEVYWDVYIEKVQRRDEGFLVNKLGAWDTDLSLIQNFFPQGDFQKEPLVKNPDDKGYLINEAGHSMMALGRLKEVEELYKKAIEIAVSQRNWKNASIGYQNLAELQILIGNLSAAKKNSKEAIRLSRKAKEMEQEYYSTTYLAYTLFLIGKRDEASIEFEKANELEIKDDSSKKYLYTSRGIWYADFLLAKGMINKTLDVTKENLKICERNKWINEINLCHRSFASIYRHQKKFKDAEEHILIAIEGAKKTGRQDIEAQSLIEFAKIKLDCHAPAVAGTRNDLMSSAESLINQALRICERCGYKLYEADCRNILSQIYLGTSRSKESKEEHAKFQSICNQTGYKPHGSTI